MVNLSGISARPAADATTATVQSKPSAAPAAKVAAPTEKVTVSTLAGRLSAAGEHTAARLQGMDHATLQRQLEADVRKVFYTLDPANKAAAASEVPTPADDASIKSAAAATAFIAGKAPNPFAGLSREQLSTISHDESGTFTVNERRAAEHQANKEEQAWRSQVVAAAMNEYNQTGKMTRFFTSVLDHFNQLPALEQATYPEDYASDLQAKIKLDFNYFNHSPGDAGPTPGSLADLAQRRPGAQPASLFDMLGLLPDAK